MNFNKYLNFGPTYNILQISPSDHPRKRNGSIKQKMKK